MHVKCVWNSCEKCVKNVWKECENWTIFTFFHMMFHNTPSSVVQGDNSMLPILSSSSKRNRRKLKPGSAKQFRMIVQRWRTRKSLFKVKLPPFSMMQTNFQWKLKRRPTSFSLPSKMRCENLIKTKKKLWKKLKLSLESSPRKVNDTSFLKWTLSKQEYL